MEWNTVVARLTPYIVKVETQDGHGTGFLCMYNPNRTFLGIATASHVVSRADQWQQPIRLHHLPTNKNVFLNEADRVILTDDKKDSAIVLVPVGKLDLPQEPIPLLPITNPLEIGTEVGWIGFPGITPQTLCFFSGIISARQDWQNAYLIDGVAIAGISGGPVVYAPAALGPHIVGTISAYVSNQMTPGLAMARDVSHFHSITGFLRDLHEAREKKKQEQEQKAREQKAQDEPAKPANPQLGLEQT